MSLSREQRREYRAIAHNLKPVIIVGDKGLTENLQGELERALTDHELIKIKVASQDREARQEAINALCESSGAEVVQTIGKIAVIMRRAKKAQPQTVQFAAPQKLTLAEFLSQTSAYLKQKNRLRLTQPVFCLPYAGPASAAPIRCIPPFRFRTLRCQRARG